MSDCLATLHCIGLDPAAMLKAQAELVAAWPGLVKAPQRPVAAPVAPFRATGEVVKRVKCPVARRVIEKAEKHWSGK